MDLDIFAQALCGDIRLLVYGQTQGRLLIHAGIDILHRNSESSRNSHPCGDMHLPPRVYTVSTRAPLTQQPEHKACDESFLKRVSRSIFV